LASLTRGKASFSCLFASLSRGKASWATFFASLSRGNTYCRGLPRGSRSPPGAPEPPRGSLTYTGHQFDIHLTYIWWPPKSLGAPQSLGGHPRGQRPPRAPRGPLTYTRHQFDIRLTHSWWPPETQEAPQSLGGHPRGQRPPSRSQRPFDIHLTSI
jgi:hypothetical protein